MRFVRDRRRWVHWLFEARKRYGITVLNFMVTSNHVHLLVLDEQNGDGIARSMQLIAARTAQEFNRRKQRRGAFWEDRYHATAVESGEHLLECMAYIDLNMCRAGVVDHPVEWECCGYHEIQQARRRYRIIDRDRAALLLGFRRPEEFASAQRAWLRCRPEAVGRRDVRWSESLAVGSEGFVGVVRQQLGACGRYREIDGEGVRHFLREPGGAYRVDSVERARLPFCDNTHPWRCAARA